LTTPKKLKGTELEKEVLSAIKSSDELTGNRYGVMTMVDADKQLRRIKSYPDIEGVISCGIQFVIECKVCSQASLRLASRIEDDKSSKQLKHLLERGDFMAITMYVIHFNERVLKTKSEPACTYAFPVHSSHEFWIRFCRGEELNINRETCEKYAYQIVWYVPPRCRRARPNIATAINRVENMLTESRSKPKFDWRESPMFRKEIKVK